MKRYWYFLLPAAALLLQPFPLVFILRFPVYQYKFGGLVSEAWEWSASVAILGILAVAIVACGTLGAYFLLTRSRLRVAVPVIVLCCFPALTAGVFYLHTLLIFLTWV